MNTDPDQGFPVLREVIQEAVFSPEEFKKRKTSLLIELVQQKEQPSLVLGPYFRKFIFGKYGYGNPIYGTDASVKKIRRMDAKIFYHAHYRPEASALAIVGDFRTARMKTKVQEYFKDWQARGKPPRLGQ